VRRSAPDNLPPGQAPPALLRIQPTPLGAPRPGLDSASESVVAIHTAHALSKNAPPDRSQGG
jgi:hypothetical protein